MSSTTYKTEYTRRSANETLPLVRMIVSDIVELATDVTETQQRLAYLTNGRVEQDDNEYSKELDSIQQVTDEKSRRLNGFIDELLQLNLDASSAEEGFVNFAARRFDQEICLCWKLGEAEVMHWHEAGEECSRRRLVDLPLIQSALAD